MNEINVGNVQATIKLDNTAFKKAMQEAKQEMKAVADESQKFNDRFKEISKALSNVGVDAKEIQKVKVELLAANPQVLENQIQSLVKKMYDLGASADQVKHLKQQIIEGTLAVKQFNEGLNNNSASELNQSILSAKNLSGELGSLGKAYAVYSDYVFTGFTKAMSLSSEFEQAMANLKSTSEMTGDQFEQLKKQALDYGGTSQFTASQVVESQTLLSQAGYKTNEVLAATPGILNLAAASGTDLATSVGITSSALQGFGLHAEDSAKVADLLAKSAIDTNLSMTDLGTALQYVAPVAGAMGISMEEAVAAIGELSQAGMTGQMAGEQLQNILLALTSPTEEAAQYMEQLGLSFTESSGKLKPLGEIIGELEASFQGLNQAQQAEAASAIVGEQAKEGFISLIRTGRDTLDGYTTSLQNAGGTAQEVADVQMDTLNGAILQLQSALEAAGITIGDNFAGSLKAIVEWLTELVVGFTNLDPSLQAALVTFPLISAGVLSAAAAIGALTIAFQALQVSVPVIGAISVALGLLGAGLAAIFVSHNEAEEATRRFEEAQQSLNDVLNESPLTRSVEEVQQLQETNESLIDILNQRAALQEQMNEIEEAVNSGGYADLSEMPILMDQMGGLENQLNAMGISAEEATEKQKQINQAIKESVPALLQMERAELSQIATKVQHVDKMNELKSQYDELSSKESLSAEQKQKLGNVVKSLVQEYPSLNAVLDGENRWHITNEGTLRSLITAEKDSIEATSKAAKDRLEIRKKEATAMLQLAEKQLKALEVISESKSPFGNILSFDPASKKLKEQVDKDKKKKQEEINGYRQSINDIDQSIQDITIGAFDKFSNVDYGSGNKTSKTSNSGEKNKGTKQSTAGTGKSAAEVAKELRDKAYNADMASVKYMADMYDWTADQQVDAYEKVRKKHQKHLKDTLQDEREMNLLLKRLLEDSAKSRYEISSSWVTSEDKRMQKSGKSEIEIAQMKVDAWTRVRSRYAQDNEYYKDADDKLVNARKTLISATEKAMKELYATNSDFLKQEERRMEESGESETEIARMKYTLWTKIRDSYEKDSEYYIQADEQVYRAKKDLISKIKKDNEDARKKEKAEYETAKKNELAAIADRKKAYTDEIDERISAIDRLIKAEDRLNTAQDYESQLAEKKARQKLLEDAVSPEGRKEYADITKEIERMELEHSRDIRKQNLEDQKQALQDEKSEREKAFDREKEDVDKHYAALIEALDHHQEDIKLIEAGVQDYRVEVTQTANAQILADLDLFIAEYNKKLAAIATASGPTQQALDLQEYNRNKEAWLEAKAAGNTEEMKRLNKRNSEIREKYGITNDTGVIDDLSSFTASSNVINPVINSVVAPLQVQTSINGGTAIFNSQQLGDLFQLLEVPKSFPTQREQPKETPVQHVNIDMSVGAVEVNDSADAELLYASRERTARRLAAAGGGTK